MSGRPWRRPRDLQPALVRGDRPRGRARGRGRGRADGRPRARGRPGGRGRPGRAMALERRPSKPCSPTRAGGHALPMATATRPGPFARKSHDALLRDATSDPEHGLKRAVGVLDLTALGIGAIIGTGIFVIIGEAIGDRGAVDHHLLRAGGRHLPVLGVLLRRAGVVDPGLGQRLHLRIRDARRARRVDHRLGPDPRVRRVGRRGGRRLGRLPASRCSTRSSASPSPSRSPGRPATAARPTCPPSFLVLAVSALLIYGVRESARTNTFMVDHEDRDPHLLRRRTASARSTATTSRRGRPTASTAPSTRPR